MTSRNIRLLCGAALLIAFGAGFGLAQLTPHTERAAHVEGNDHNEHNGPDEHDDETPEGVVVLTTRQIEASGIGIVAVGRGGGNETRLTGRVESALDARTVISTIVGGRVEQVQVAPGSSVEAGAALAVVISGEAAILRANAEAAAAEAEAARLEYRRDSNLVELGVVARQELEASRARSLAADAATRAAQAQVIAAGSPDAQGRVTIVSPIAGVVGTVQVTPGGFVAAGGGVAEVSNPAQTELVFTAPPALAAQVISGSRIEVTGPSDNFEAVVVGVAANVRERGNATLIRARPVSGALPPAGSPVTGIIVTDRQEDGLTVPADAVQTVDGRSVVFIATDEGFRATPVLAGRRAGGQIEILNGLDGSEHIAGINAFLLKAELAKGEVEHSH